MTEGLAISEDVGEISAILHNDETFSFYKFSNDGDIKVSIPDFGADMSFDRVDSLANIERRYLFYSAKVKQNLDSIVRNVSERIIQHEGFSGLHEDPIKTEVRKLLVHYQCLDALHEESVAEQLPSILEKYHKKESIHKITMNQEMLFMFGRTYDLLKTSEGKVVINGEKYTTVNRTTTSAFLKDYQQRINQGAGNLFLSHPEVSQRVTNVLADFLARKEPLPNYIVTDEQGLCGVPIFEVDIMGKDTGVLRWLYSTDNADGAAVCWDMWKNYKYLGFSKRYLIYPETRFVIPLNFKSGKEHKVNVSNGYFRDGKGEFPSHRKRYMHPFVSQILSVKKTSYVCIDSTPKDLVNLITHTKEVFNRGGAEKDTYLQGFSEQKSFYDNLGWWSNIQKGYLFNIIGDLHG